MNVRNASAQSVPNAYDLNVEINSDGTVKTIPR